MQIKMRESNIDGSKRIVLCFPYNKNTITLIKKLKAGDGLLTHVTNAAKHKIVSPLDNSDLEEDNNERKEE